MHIKKHNRKAFWRHFQRGVVRDRFFGDQDPAGVHASLVGIFLQQHPIFLYLLYNLTARMEFHWIFSQRVEFFLWEPKDFADLPKDGTVFKFHISAAESHMLITIARENIFQNGIALFPAPVDIKIRRALAVQ